MEYPQRVKKIKKSVKELLNFEISVVNHEGVVSASQKRIIEKEFEKVILESARIMEMLGLEIEKEGGVIGHIKSFVKSGEASGRLSLTNKKTDIAFKGSSIIKKCEVDINMIILNSDEETVKKYVKLYFEKLLKLE